MGFSERDLIDGEAGTRIMLPSSPFSKSIKEPDVLIDPGDGHNLPSVVIEAGWSEDMSGLEADIELLLRGSGGLTKVAILVKLYLREATRQVSGEASVWTLNAFEQPVRRQTEVCEKLDQNCLMDYMF
jgi:hypothetical protein